MGTARSDAHAVAGLLPLLVNRTVAFLQGDLRSHETLRWNFPGCRVRAASAIRSRMLTTVDVEQKERLHSNEDVGRKPDPHPVAVALWARIGYGTLNRSVPVAYALVRR